jgi:hypothetical protein
VNEICIISIRRRSTRSCLDYDSRLVVMIDSVPISMLVNGRE